MRLYGKHPDILMHAQDMWKLIYGCTRVVGKSKVGVTLLEMVTGERQCGDRRPLHTEEKDLLCDRAIQRFERTFFPNIQANLFETKEPQ